MVDEIRQLYPHTQLLAVGFSMGGNIVTKYLGEDESHQQKFILGMAVCQGYDISRYVSFKEYYKCKDCLSQNQDIVSKWSDMSTHGLLYQPISNSACQNDLVLLDTTLCDKICHYLATGQLFSPGTPVSSTNKTDHHEITEILLKVALNTLTL